VIVKNDVALSSVNFKL